MVEHDAILYLNLMALINLRNMAEFFRFVLFFFYETVTCDAEKTYFLWLFLAKYPRLENLYKMLIDFLYKMAQTI